MKKHFSTLLLVLSVSHILSQGTWTQKADFAGTKRFGAIGFSIGNKGYIGTGVGAGFSAWYKDLWEWDQATDTWTQKANLPDTSRAYAVGFAIADKGYVCTGYNWNIGYFYKELWEYDPALNTWKQKANFPGAARHGAVVFTIGNLAYVGTGSVLPSFYDDLWEYNALVDTWTQKASFLFSERSFATAFSIGNKGYLGTGSGYTSGYNDLWEFDPATNAWTQMANLPSTKRDDAIGFSIGNYGYIGMGDSIDFQTNKYVPLSDFWQYNPNTNSWAQMANYGGVAVARPTGFVIGCRGYVGTGWSDPANFTGALNDFWEFTPPVPSAVVAGVNTFCAGDSSSLFASGGLFYQWSTGETSQVIDVKPTTTTTYSVIVSDACGADTANITVTVIPYPVISVTPNVNLCGTGAVQFTDNSFNANAWYWTFGDGNSSSLQNPSHTYNTTGQFIVTVTISPSPFGCESTSQLTVDVPPYSELYIPTAFSPNGDGNNDVYYIFGSCIKEFHFMIFDRWGEKVFETTDNSIGWDGKHKGKLLDPGVFMYSFVGTSNTGDKLEQKGSITLLK